MQISANLLQLFAVSSTFATIRTEMISTPLKLSINSAALKLFIQIACAKFSSGNIPQIRLNIRSLGVSTPTNT